MIIWSKITYKMPILIYNNQLKIGCVNGLINFKGLSSDLEESSLNPVSYVVKTNYM